MFFLGGQPGLWRIFTDVLKKAHPDSLPPGMPLLNPLLLLQVLLPPICKISILYFLNEQGRETPRKGFSASISPQVQRWARSLFILFFFKCAKATRHGKGNEKVDASVHMTEKKRKGYFSSSFIDNHVSASLVSFRGWCFLNCILHRSPLFGGSPSCFFVHRRNISGTSVTL